MLYIDGIVYTWHGGGGVGVYFKELVGYLSQVGYDFKYIDYVGDSPLINNISLDARLCERYRDCDFIPEKNSIFHSSYYRLPSASDLKVVTTVHDFIYEKTSRGPKRWVHSYQKSRAINRSDHIICVSNNTRDDFFEFYPDYPKDRVSVIYNGVSNIFVNRPYNSGVDYPGPYVLFVGSRSWYKNFKNAVLAIASLKNYSLLIAGGGGLNKDEHQFLEKYLPGRYKALGAISTEDLNDLYYYAHCLLYPSLYEGFGIPVVEAMKVGCPVIALNTSSIPEVADKHGILLSSASPDDLAGAIKYLEDNDVRKNCIDGGIQWASNFSWGKTARGIHAIYDGFRW